MADLTLGAPLHGVVTALADVPDERLSETRLSVALRAQVRHGPDAHPDRDDDPLSASEADHSAGSLLAEWSVMGGVWVGK